MRLAKLWGDPATRPRVEDYGKSYYEVLGVGRQVP